MCLVILFTCMSVYPIHAWCLRRPKKGHQISWNQSYTVVSTMWVLKIDRGPLEE